jgi:uncharacterized protein (DUF2237 family)
MEIKLNARVAEVAPAYPDPEVHENPTHAIVVFTLESANTTHTTGGNFSVAVPPEEIPGYVPGEVWGVTLTRG